MPFHRDSSPGRQSRSRAGLDTLHTSARARGVDAVLVLYAEDVEPSPRPAPKDPMSEDTVLAPLFAERDAALEEVAYLREQLHSQIAYHSHLLDEERRRMFDERTELARELTSLREELHHRTYPAVAARTRSARGPRTTRSDDVSGAP